MGASAEDVWVGMDCTAVSSLANDIHIMGTVAVLGNLVPGML